MHTADWPGLLATHLRQTADPRHRRVPTEHEFIFMPGVRALREMSNRRTNPPQTPEQILELLVTRHNMTEVAEILLPLLAEDTPPG
ncbi:MAG: hypothetical protein ACRDUS_04935 [Mycobacterium sp.]